MTKLLATLIAAAIAAFTFSAVAAPAAETPKAGAAKPAPKKAKKTQESGCTGGQVIPAWHREKGEANPESVPA